MALTGDERLTGFTLRMERIEVLAQPLLGRFAHVDRTLK